MPTSNRLSMLVGLVLLILFPIVFGQVALASLQKLHISPEWAFYLVLAIIVGGLVNIPVTRIVKDEPVWSHPLSVFGLDKTMPRWMAKRGETVIAVNVGGCFIPVGIALYQLLFIAPLGTGALSAVALAVAINTFVCYLAATPVPSVGIVMPGFVAPVTAILSAVLLAPEIAPPVAFVAGVLGPVLGADLLHIKDLVRAPVGVASIGGAGTFDGIVLSGIFAAYLTPVV